MKVYMTNLIKSLFWLFKASIVFPFVIVVIIVAAILGKGKRYPIVGPDGRKCVSIVTHEIAIYMLFSVIEVKDPMLVELFRSSADKKMIAFSGVFYKFFDKATAEVLMRIITFNQVFGYSLELVMDSINFETVPEHERNKVRQSATRWLTTFGADAMEAIKNDKISDGVRDQIKTVMTIMLYLERNQPPTTNNS